MNATLTQDMVDGMGDTAGLLGPIQPAFKFDPVGIAYGRTKKEKLFRGLKTPGTRGISIPTRDQSIADMHRRDSIKRGGI